MRQIKAVESAAIGNRPDSRRRPPEVDTIVDAGQICEKQDWGSDSLRTEKGDDGKPIKPWQHAINNDDVERFGGRRLKTLASVCGDFRPVSTGLQTRGHEIRGLGIIFDDQDFHALFVSGASALIQTQSNGESCDPPRGLATQPFPVKQ